MTELINGRWIERGLKRLNCLRFLLKSILFQSISCESHMVRYDYIRNI
jgi:hypothetical protein